MKRQDAITIDRLTQQASRLLDQSVAEVTQRASPRAASVYRSAIGRAMGNMAAGLLFPIWREHADLEPEGMKGPGDYNPREFTLSDEAAATALGAIAEAESLMHEVESLVAQLEDPAEREQYLSEVAAVTIDLRNAARGVQRRVRK
jgi:hypothetical protein